MSMRTLSQLSAALLVLAGWGMQLGGRDPGQLVIALTICGFGIFVGGQVLARTRALPSKLIGMAASAGIVFAGVMQLAAAPSTSPAVVPGVFVLSIAAFLLTSEPSRSTQPKPEFL